LKKVGRVRVAAEAGLAVDVDGEAVGTAPVEDELYVEPGEHLIEAKRSDGATSSERFVVDEGELVRVRLPDVSLPVAAAESTPNDDSAPPPPPPAAERKRHNWAPAYVFGGVAVATLASGIVLRVVAGNKLNKIEGLSGDLQPGECHDASRAAQCDELESLTKSQRNLGIAADATMIVSGVFAAATLGWVVYELARPKHAKNRPTTSTMPLLEVSAQRAWVGLRGQF
jgi:hypothetical protein